MIIIGAIAGSENEEVGYTGELALDGSGLSPYVMQHRDVVAKYAKEEGIEEYVPFILGIMEQESGGKGNDPMQASESLCGRIGCITDPHVSIKQGVKYFKNVLDKAGGDVLLAVASYNMGEGFISYYQERQGKKKYTLNETINGKKTNNTIISFSRYHYQKNPSIYNCSRAEGKDLGACHGDIMYVWSVLNHSGASEGGAINAEIIGNKVWVTPHTKRITSHYNPRRVHPKSGEVRPHNGIDISDGSGETQIGEPVLSFMDGVVVQASRSGGAGNMVKVEHSGGISTVYMHLNSFNVHTGKRVKAGEVVGGLGNTGFSTGPHLHFEIRINGNAVNPMPHVEEFIN